MIAQMFKLVWNRKRANLLLMGELLCAFMVVFAVATFGLYYANNFRRPLGFEYENVWSVYCLPDFSMLAKGGSTELGSAYASIYRELQQFEEIETVAGAESMVPYSMVSTSISTAQFEDAEVRAYTGRVSEGFFDALGLELVEGRWFDDSDAALTRGSIVITEQLRRDLFDETNAVGKIVQIGNHTSVGTPGQTSDEGLRVVGVVADFRRGGEFEGIDPVLFHRLELDDAETLNKYFPSHFLLKMRPGTPLALQERLATRIQSITTDLRLEFSTLEQSRSAAFKWRLLPLWIGAAIAALLIGMVGLSLLGVIWQNVTQRTAEIGLRRAVGGPILRVQMQFVGELMVITSIAVVIGAGLILQFPLLDLVTSVSNGVYLASLGVAALVIYLLAMACALYPSLMATRIAPSDALHYE